MAEITSLLQAAAAGEEQALGELVPLLYADLRRLARSRMRRMGSITLLDTTGLIHETYLYLRDAKGLEFPDRKRFFGYASHVMRALAIDAARSRKTLKRGAGEAFVTFTTDIAGLAAPSCDDVLRLNDALEELARADERLARVVEMRFFGGLSEAEIAECLDVTDRTVQRDWRKARLFLLDALRA